MDGEVRKYWLLRLSDGKRESGWLKQIVSEKGAGANIVLAYERDEAWKIRSVFQAKDITRMLRRMGYGVERVEVNPWRDENEH